MTKKTRSIVTTAIVAALYATLTLSLAFVMTLLPLFSKKYIVGLTIGCFLANLLGLYGVPDMIFGTIATFISVYLVYLTGKYMKDKKSYVYAASLWPVIVNAIIVAVQLKIFFGMPLFITMLQVGFGQFVVITIIGVPLFKAVNNKYGKYLKNMF